MKFLADENIEKPIVESLRKQGFDVLSIAEERRSLDDEAVLALANKESRILITNDKDFGAMAFRLHRVHAGIFLLRFQRDDAQWKAQRLTQFLTQYQKPLIGKFVVLRDTRVRIRSLQH